MKQTLLYIFLIATFVYAGSNELYKVKADFYLNNQNYGLAVEYYKKLSNPDYSILNRIGFAYYCQGQFQKAVPFFLKALNFNTNKPYIYNNLGATYIKLKQYDLANISLTKAITKKKAYTKALYNLAVALFYQRQYKQSLKYVLLAVQHNKKYVKMRFNKQRTLREVKRLRKQYPHDKELEKIEKKLGNLS